MGNSLTVGVGAQDQTADSYIAQLPSFLPGWNFTTFKDGYSGATTAFLLLHEQVSTKELANSRKNAFVIIECGPNDVFNTVDPAVTLAGIATLKARYIAAGYTPFFGTLFPWVWGSPLPWDQTIADAINTGVLSIFDSAHIIPWATTAEFQITSGYQSVYRVDSGVNAGHLTRLGYGAMARDAAPVLLAARVP